MSADAWLTDPAFHAKFWASVDKRGPDECWEWTGSRKPPFGYGHCYLGGGRKSPRHTTASRVSLGLAIGRPLVRGEVACHKCDNPPCVNPAHLFVGTQSDNALDSVAKGRARRAQGSATGAAKLTEEQVQWMRGLEYYYGLNSDLAREFGVSRHTIRTARLGMNWKSVA